MSKEQHWVSVNWLKALGAGLGVMVCFLTYLLLTGIDNPSALVSFLLSALPSAAVVLLAYLIGSYLLFRRGIAGSQQLREEIVDAVVEASQSAPGIVAIYTEFAAPPWSLLWSESHYIELVARFFDGIVTPIPAALEQFWKHPNASVRVVVPNPAASDALELATKQRDVTGMFEEDTLGRILQGLWAIETSRASQGAPKAAFQIFLADDPLNYSAYCFDSDQLLLSPYEHRFTPTARAPRSHFILDRNEQLAKFWASEFEYLTRGDSFNFAAYHALVKYAREGSDGSSASTSGKAP